MKLTKRESFLIKLVGFIALIVISYYFIIAPQLDKLTNVRSELDEKVRQVESVKSEIQSLSQLEDELNILKGEIKSLSEDFFPELQQRKLLIIMDEQLRASGTKADSLDFAQLMEVEIQSEEDSIITQEETQSEATDPNPDEIPFLPEIQYMSIDIPFKGTYPKIMDFISRLENLNRHIIFSSLQMTRDMDGKISGTISMEFYSLKKLADDSGDDEFLNWSYNTPMGTDNPFRLTSATRTGEQTTQEEAAPEDSNEEETTSETSEPKDTETDSVSADQPEL